MIPLRRAVQKHTRGTTQIASPSQAIPLIGLQQALSTDAADAGGFYSLSFSSLRLGSDSRTPAPGLAPSAISLGVQLAFDPLRLSLSFNLLESYHSFLKLSTKKCAAQRKMSSPDERLCLPCQREGDRVSGGGIRGAWFVFAETLGESVPPAANPPAQMCFGTFGPAPFNKGAILLTAGCA